MQIVYKNNDNVVELRGVADYADKDTPITDATISLVVIDRQGSQVTGETWPLPMVHQGAGTYAATLEPEVNLEVGGTYWAEITATDPFDNDGFWRVPLDVQWRSS